VARIVSFRELPPVENPRPHTEVECGWRITTADGETILQLDTYGSNDREISGKVSQTLQFDERTASALLQLLKRAFPSLDESD
jgi:hypothetical protein